MTRAVPVEDGARLELALEHGQVYAVAAAPNPGLGETVRIRIDGGVRFPAAEARSPAASG